MRFILKTGSLNNLNTLRADYEATRKLDLSKQPSFFGLPILLGGANVEARNAQIGFLEKIKFILQPNLLNVEDIKTPEQWQANLTASRTMLAACLYVLSQLEGSKKNSNLYRLIQNNLGITSENFLDENDLECCLHTAHRLISSPNALDEVNVILIKAGKKPILEAEWHGFTKFLTQKPLDDAKLFGTNFPVISITKPFFGAVFACSGATLGILAGDVITRSTKAIPLQYQLTAFLGSTVLLRPLGPNGVAVLAPLIAIKLINTFCSTSLGYLLATSMNAVGQGVGIGVGLPLDLAYQLLSKACSLVKSYDDASGKILTETGIRIEDGLGVINGIAIELKVKTLIEPVLNQPSELTDNLQLQIEFRDISDSEIQGPMASAEACEVESPISEPVAVPAIKRNDSSSSHLLDIEEDASDFALKTS